MSLERTQRLILSLNRLIKSEDVELVKLVLTEDLCSQIMEVTDGFDLVDSLEEDEKLAVYETRSLIAGLTSKNIDCIVHVKISGIQTSVWIDSTTHARESSSYLGHYCSLN